MNTLEVRDMRRKEKFFVDDEYLNGYAKLCGVSATAVYFVLCRHADRNQECFPSMETIAEKLGISRRTVITAIKTLVEWNIIAKGERKRKKGGEWMHNTYILLDKTVWKNKPSANISHGDQVQITTSPSANNDTHQVQPFHTKDTHKKDTHKKDTHKKDSKALSAVAENAIVSKEWNTYIDAFKEVNPLWEDIYKNKTERKALQHLADKIGKEKLLRTLEALPEIVSQPYAPKITKPTELKRDLGKLITFVKQNNRTSNKYQITKIH
jgi:predicted transcriptional regulator